MIPKIIHQTWKSKHNIPDKFRHWSSSFKEVNDGFKYCLYDDSDNLNLVKNFSPGLLSVYKEFPLEIYRVDFVRALYLLYYGGFYADMDFQCLRSLSKHCDSEVAIFCSMGNDMKFEHSVPNAMMCSPIGHSFWVFYLYNIVNLFAKSIDSKVPIPAPEYLTGPVILRNCITEFPRLNALTKDLISDFFKKNFYENVTLKWGGISILPSSTWYPIDWNNRADQMLRQKLINENILYSVEEARKIFPNSEAVTYWTHSWPGIDIGIASHGMST